MARFVMYWTVLTLGPLLLAIALVISSYVLALPLLAEAGESFQMKARLLGVAAVPDPVVRADRRLRADSELQGALAPRSDCAFVAALLFEVAKYAFTSYVTSGSSYSQIYGALAVIPVFIVWIYLSWIIVLLGASLTAVDVRVRLSGERAAAARGRGISRACARPRSFRRRAAHRSRPACRRPARVRGVPRRQCSHDAISRTSIAQA